MLEGGEKGVEFGERGAVGGLQFSDGGNAGGEGALKIDGRKNNTECFDFPHAQIWNCNCADTFMRLFQDKW
jgi:hypothetical protein